MATAATLNLKVSLRRNMLFKPVVVPQAGPNPLNKKASNEALLHYKKPGGDLLSHAKSILSSAQNRFTALFEMGRGGSNSLWPPDITGIRIQGSGIS